MHVLNIAVMLMAVLTAHVHRMARLSTSVFAVAGLNYPVTAKHAGVCAICYGTYTVHNKKNSMTRQDETILYAIDNYSVIKLLNIF